MRKLWSNLILGLSEILREQIADLRDKKEKTTEDNSRQRGVEIQLKAAAQRGFPEDTTDPVVATSNYDNRQPGRVLTPKQ